MVRTRGQRDAEGGSNTESTVNRRSQNRTSNARRGDAGKKSGSRRESHRENRRETPISPCGRRQDLKEDNNKEYLNLIQRVRAQQRQQEKEALRRELADKEPEIDVKINSVSLPIQKRRQSSSDKISSRKRTFLRSLKMSETPVFNGKSQKELQNFNIE